MLLFPKFAAATKEVSSKSAWQQAVMWGRPAPAKNHQSCVHVACCELARGCCYLERTYSSPCLSAGCRARPAPATNHQALSRKIAPCSVCKCYKDINQQPSSSCNPKECNDPPRFK
eukprot:scaffold12745_cov18-Tisochrysis_lutea.AAC.1